MINPKVSKFMFVIIFAIFIFSLIAIGFNDSSEQLDQLDENIKGAKVLKILPLFFCIFCVSALIFKFKDCLCK